MRAVLILIDGARTDVLKELLGIPFLFGRYPGSVNIPGIRWLDRRGAAGGWRDQWRAAGADFRGSWEIPAHRAGHGSLSAEHMEVPILASVALPEAPVRTVDLMPTILERLGVAVPPGVAFDGVPFSRLAPTTVPLIR